jgi:hypothetical protein
VAIQAYISASEQGVAQIENDPDWQTIRDDLGDLATYNEYTSLTIKQEAIGATFSSRGNTYFLYRTFLVFDVSSITSAGTITNIDLEISGSTNNSDRCYSCFCFCLWRRKWG